MYDIDWFIAIATQTLKTIFSGHFFFQVTRETDQIFFPDVCCEITNLYFLMLIGCSLFSGPDLPEDKAQISLCPYRSLRSYSNFYASHGLRLQITEIN